MCGIAGYAGFNDPGLASRMIDALRHRGPDSGAVAEFPDARMALGIRRLAVLDLETGDQPMVSSDGRVHLVMNGEIYNYRELRRRFVDNGYQFRSQSDTEVVLAAYLEWGTAAWSHLDGMFAVAIADRRSPDPQLVLARDRVGIKPLYVASAGGQFAFASEIKALRQWHGGGSDINLGAIRDYLALRYVPGPRTMFTAVEKFPPGYSAVICRGTATMTRWWTPPLPSNDGGDAVARFGAALRAAVHSHMVADVPVGAFLSGGIDSSAIVALMREAVTAPLHTFSIGFPDFPDDDQRGAAATARHLGTIHHAIECRAADMASLRDIAWSLDEPVGDAIVVPMSVLSREARQHVTVVLSGEGADEILGGYLFHRRLVELAALRRGLPAVVWRTAAALARRAPVGLLGLGFDYPGALGTAGRRKVAGLLDSVAADPLVAMYRKSVSLFDDDDVRAIAAPALRSLAGDRVGPALAAPAGLSPLQSLVNAQFTDWLPDDILMKADKMSMAHSLELRVPFMDASVIRAAIDLPDRQRLTLRTNKRALREFARPLLPAGTAATPKRAFYVPLESYAGVAPLRDLFREMLDPERIRRRGLFDAGAVRAVAAAAPSDGFLALKRQFAIVMLELWFQNFAPDACW